MLFVPRRRRLRFVLVALLLAVGFQLSADALLHTDDGCVVETHCLVCQWHYGATVVPAVGPTPAGPVVLGRVLLPAPTAPDLAPPSLEVSPRGPPLT